jgi:hypothetical protein
VPQRNKSPRHTNQSKSDQAASPSRAPQRFRKRVAIGGLSAVVLIALTGAIHDLWQLRAQTGKIASIDVPLAAVLAEAQAQHHRQQALADLALEFAQGTASASDPLWKAALACFAEQGEHVRFATSSVLQRAVMGEKQGHVGADLVKQLFNLETAHERFEGDVATLARLLNERRSNDLAVTCQALREHCDLITQQLTSLAELTAASLLASNEAAARSGTRLAVSLLALVLGFGGAALYLRRTARRIARTEFAAGEPLSIEIDLMPVSSASPQAASHAN